MPVIELSRIDQSSFSMLGVNSEQAWAQAHVLRQFHQFIEFLWGQPITLLTLRYTHELRDWSGATDTPYKTHYCRIDGGIEGPVALIKDLQQGDMLSHATADFKDQLKAVEELIPVSRRIRHTVGAPWKALAAYLREVQAENAVLRHRVSQLEGQLEDYQEEETDG